MDRFNNLLEIGFISGVVGIITESFIDIKTAYIVLLVMIIIDTIAGMLSAGKRKRFNSRGLRKIIKKVITYSLAIITVRLLELAVVSIFETAILSNSVIAFLALTETVSIMENLTLSGVPMSSRLLTFIFTVLKIGDVKGAFEDNADESKSYIGEIEDIIKYQIPTFHGVCDMKELITIQFDYWKEIAIQIDLALNPRKVMSNEYIYYRVVSLVESGIKDMKRKWQDEGISNICIESFDKVLQKQVSKLQIKIKEICFVEEAADVKKAKLIDSIVTMLYKFIVEAQKGLSN